MDAPLPHSTQALLTTVARMADEGTASPEQWSALGDVILQHAGWLERYLRTVGKRPDSMALTFEFLRPILEQLRRVEAHLSPMARAWLRIALRHAAQSPAGRPS